MAERNNGSITGIPPSGPPGYQPVFRNPGDWVAAVALVPFALSAFVLEWISVRVRVPDYIPVVGGMESRRLRSAVGFLDIPWYWIVLVFLVLAGFVACFFIVRTRGIVTLAAGVLFLVFGVVFFFGAWYKINAIIGDVLKLIADIPLIGQLLEDALERLTKDSLIVTFQAGFYVFIAAGALLVTGGAIRLFTGRKGVRTGAGPVPREVPDGS